MRTTDIDRLSQPYDGDDTMPTPGPNSALGVKIPTWKRLETAILDDLNETPPYGVAWWAPHPGTSRRILISDQLYACTESVSSNMIEAALHLLEFVDFADRHSDRMADVIKIKNDGLSVEAPRPRCPLEELSIQLVSLHMAGVVRALAGALDCLAGTIIGILALPQSILKADFDRVRELLRKTVARTLTEGDRVQSNFAVELESLIRAAGPAGWLDWELAFRNMLVHRGRRIELGRNQIGALIGKAKLSSDDQDAALRANVRFDNGARRGPSEPHEQLHTLLAMLLRLSTIYDCHRILRDVRCVSYVRNLTTVRVLAAVGQKN